MWRLFFLNLVARDFIRWISMRIYCMSDNWDVYSIWNKNNVQKLIFKVRASTLKIFIWKLLSYLIVVKFEITIA